MIQQPSFTLCKTHDHIWTNYSTTTATPFYYTRQTALFHQDKKAAICLTGGLCDVIWPRAQHNNHVRLSFPILSESLLLTWVNQQGLQAQQQSIPISGFLLANPIDHPACLLAVPVHGAQGSDYGPLAV